VNPKKIKTIVELEPPETVRKVQKLSGCIAALSWFISWLGEKALPIYKPHWKNGKFHWSDEAKAPFVDLKLLLLSNMILASIAEVEPMLLYISATT
jgi:hypothetical protein